MKRIVLAAALTLLPTLAISQQASPSNDEMVAAYYTETGQLRAALGSAQREIIALKKQLEDAKKSVVDTKPTTK